MDITECGYFRQNYGEVTCVDMREKVRRLEQLKELRREVDLLSQRIAELELAAQGGAGRITGMPRAGRRWDRMGDYAAKIADIWDRLEARRLRCMELLGALYAFIDDIEDSLLRQIFTRRYIDGETWQRIAFLIGDTDEQYPRRLHNRYLMRPAVCPGAEFDENDERKVL